MGRTLKVIGGATLAISLMLLSSPTSNADITQCVLSPGDSPPGPPAEEVERQVMCVMNEVPEPCVDVFIGPALWRWTVEGAPVGPEVYPDAGMLAIVQNECDREGTFAFAGAIAEAECHWEGNVASGTIVFKSTDLTYESTECWGGFPIGNLPVCVAIASIYGDDGAISVGGETISSIGVCQ